MERYIQVFTTVSKRADADRIARSLAKSRLAACVQVVGPIKSTYNWKGKTETSKEWLCIIKSRRGLYKKIEAHLKSIHGYELPEITCVDMSGSSEYLDWIAKETKN